MKIRITTLLTVLLYTALLNAQSISGNLKQLAGQKIQLDGFDGLKTYLIDKTTADEKGNFTLNYSNNDIGIG